MNSLGKFGLLHFSGADARSFLHSQLSCDVNTLEAARAQFGSYNTPQGRMLASFLLCHTEAGYFMQLARELTASIRKRLTMYILRAKVEIADVSEQYEIIGLARAHDALAAMFGRIPDGKLELTANSGAYLLRLDDRRFEIIAPRDSAQALLAALGSTAGGEPAQWEWLDIRAGIPWITPATQEQFVPQMANLDVLGGVSFNKGCYPGQEIVARMHYLGRLKQRMYLANIPGATSPQPGDKLFSSGFGEQASGMIVNAAPAPGGGHDVLAVMQIESAQRADARWQSLAGPALKFIELPYRV